MMKFLRYSFLEFKNELQAVIKYQIRKLTAVPKSFHILRIRFHAE